MSEEFKPIRITLSQEAFDQMEKIMSKAAFRSYSSTVEECIRGIYDIIKEILILAGPPGSSPRRPTTREYTEAMTRVVVRMSRFTGKVPSYQLDK